MSRCVVDTNVAIVANGRPSDEEHKSPSIECRLAAVKLLMAIEKNGRVLLDAAGEIQSEYRRYLNPRGSPGVGDRFYQIVLQSSPRLVERIDLPKRPDGEYIHLPEALSASRFDPSDRKFAALARMQGVPVYNAIDSDWLEHGKLLESQGIEVRNLCGCDETKWYASNS